MLTWLCGTRTATCEARQRRSCHVSSRILHGSSQSTFGAAPCQMVGGGRTRVEKRVEGEVETLSLVGSAGSLSGQRCCSTSLEISSSMVDGLSRRDCARAPLVEAARSPALRRRLHRRCTCTCRESAGSLCARGLPEDRPNQKSTYASSRRTRPRTGSRGAAPTQATRDEPTTDAPPP